MPLIECTFTTAEHRTPEMMRSLISALTAAVVDTGVAPQESVRVILREVPAEHFAAGDVTLAERRAAAAQSTPSDQKGS
ncbi:MAG: 4-oxalocrotonate tautomerase family protein [Austwickia sp.]|nr:4-oxalocrotonate tautomerase family protein [Actinomycetota bacterium]MCB1251800.1 tautomerase family protein [Austwickia sp.]MCO5308260.1 4-oxalocrotonate tautomerase family protein [Austwickia sp.]